MHLPAVPDRRERPQVEAEVNRRVFVQSAGVAAIFGPGTNITTAAHELVHRLSRQHADYPQNDATSTATD